MAQVEFRFGELTEFVPGAIWYVDYPVHYGGLDFAGRMVVIRLSDGRVMLQSPCEISDELKAKIEEIGPVAYLIAPGNFHHLHVPAAQAAFPGAETWIAPGIRKKRPDLVHTGVLGEEPNPGWAEDLVQQPVTGRIISEVVFLHRDSGTLIVVDLIELIGDMVKSVGWGLKLWWKLFRMWNRPSPAPEYWIPGWRDRKAANAAFERIMGWEFSRILLQHGANVETDARAVAEAAWGRVLR